MSPRRPAEPDPEDDWADSEGDVPYLPDGLEDEEAPWRGLEHPADWPKEDAGCEYRAWLAELGNPEIVDEDEPEDEELDDEEDAEGDE